MSKALTPEVESDILASYKRTRSPFKTAVDVGVDIKLVWSVIDAGKENGKLSVFEERHGGKGRPEMEQYVAASRRVGEHQWDPEDVGVIRAREAFEAGTHLMATGRDGQWLLLYAIPRKGPRDPKPGYFQQEKN